MERKIITYGLLNHIKDAYGKIFEELDCDEPNNVTIANIYSGLERIFDSIGYSYKQRRELSHIIRWHDDNNVRELEKNGWGFSKTVNSYIPEEYDKRLNASRGR